MALVIHEPLPHIPASKICKTGNPRVLALGGGGNAPGIVAAMVTYVQELLKSGHDVVGLFGSWPALKNSDVSQMPMIDFKNIPAQQLRALIAEGGTQLGVGRDILWKSEFNHVVQLRQKLNIIGACGVGGDGTLSAAQALQYSHDESGNPVCNIAMGGKTIDNDMEHNDTAIGFMTCVHKSAESIINGLKLAHGKGITTVVDIYGRHNGHITLYASSLVRGEHPLITLIPEVSISREHFLQRHNQLKKEHGYVCVAIAEGFVFEGEKHDDAGPRDGRGNKKLEGGKMLLKALEENSITVEGFKPGWDTRECPPIEQDIRLAQSVGRAVATLVQNRLWGTAVAAQGSLENGYELIPLPLWQIETGHSAPTEAYDELLLKPTVSFASMVGKNLNPAVSELKTDAFDVLRAQHKHLMKRVCSSKHVCHNGVYIPQWAIVPDKDGKEQVTEWTKPIRELLTKQ